MQKNLSFSHIGSTLALLAMLLTSCNESDNPVSPNTPEEERILTEYEQTFEANFGQTAANQTWNMASTQSIQVSLGIASTVNIYGNYTASIFGAKKLATFNDVNGMQTLTFEMPLGLNYFYVVASNELFARGQMTDGSTLVDFTTASTAFTLTDCITSELQDIEADPMIFAYLPESHVNTGKVTQSSLYVSDGKPFTVTPVYSNCGLTNTLGLYVQKGKEGTEMIDLWTKTQNHINGIQKLPVFTITLPAGTIFGFYIKNSVGTYFTDSSLNPSNCKSVGTIKGEDRLYLAFEDMPLNGDFDFNDIVCRISPALTPLDTEAAEWIVAVEATNNRESDFDFNDLVFKVNYVKGENFIIITPLAAGIADEIEIYLNEQRIGEIHELLGGSVGTCINTVDSEPIYSGTIVSAPSIRIETETLFSLADKLGGLRVKVNGNFIDNARIGYPTQILIIADGSWRWPSEGTKIGWAYPEFNTWVGNPQATNWIYLE